MCYLKVEELKLVPEQSEKAIAEFKEKLVKLEEDKKKHEEKLAEVMESLKTETKVTKGLNFDSTEFRHIYIYKYFLCIPLHFLSSTALYL